MRLDDGLVVTRTNAGVDNISTYRKLHVFRPAADRIFVLQSAGNLASTQEVLDRLSHDLRSAGGAESLATVNEMYEAALYVGRVSRTVVNEHRDGLMSSGADGTATFILSGQITGGPPDIMLIYPEGNYIRASDDRPFLQIGESKYGKFMLDIGVRSHANLAVAAKLALASMMSTARANLSVGPPYDLAGLPQRCPGPGGIPDHRGLDDPGAAAGPVGEAHPGGVARTARGQRPGRTGERVHDEVMKVHPV